MQFGCAIWGNFYLLAPTVIYPGSEATAGAGAIGTALGCSVPAEGPASLSGCFAHNTRHRAGVDSGTPAVAVEDIVVQDMLAVAAEDILAVAVQDMLAMAVEDILAVAVEDIGCTLERAGKGRPLVTLLEMRCGIRPGY